MKCSRQVNVREMRAFIQLRQMISTHKDLKKKIAAMERKYDEQFAIVFEAIKQLLEEDDMPKRKIGYVKERKASYGKRKTKKAGNPKNTLKIINFIGKEKHRSYQQLFPFSFACPARPVAPEDGTG